MAITLSIHVNGPVVPQCNIGSASAYINLGVCEEGADIDFQIASRDIKPDASGGSDGFEVDTFFLNMIATIKFTLVPFAGNQINSLRSLSHAASKDSINGVMIESGTLYGTGGFLPSLYLPSGDVDGPWWFRKCRVMKPGSNRVGTKPTKPMFEFRAINYVASSVTPTLSGNILYSRSAPP